MTLATHSLSAHSFKIWNKTREEVRVTHTHTHIDVKAISDNTLCKYKKWRQRPQTLDKSVIKGTTVDRNI